VGSAGSAQAVNVSIAAGTAVGSIAVVTGGIPNLDFASAAGSTCVASMYNTAANCQVNVSFTPLEGGLRRGAVVFYSGAGNSGTVLAAVPLFGVGTGPQVAFGPGGTQTTVGSGYSSPRGVAVDPAGNVYVADATAVDIDNPNPSVYSGSIDMITPSGTKIVLGTPFAYPVGVAVDGAGNVYVADSEEAAVGQIPPSGTQTTVGTGFSSPVAVAVDGAGNVYVADTGKASVFKIAPGGMQATVGSGLSTPSGVAVDSAGNVYIADPGKSAVYQVTPGGAQTPMGSGFSKPEGVAVDAAGNVYVVDAGTNTLYEVTPGGTKSTIATGFKDPTSLAVDGAGNLYVADYKNTRVVKINRASAPSLNFATTNVGSTSTDSPKTIEVENIGNETLTFAGLSYPTDFPEANGGTNPCTSSTSLGLSQLCNLEIDFTPQSSGGLSESVTLTDNALNATGATQLIAVSGTGTGSGLKAQAIAFTPPPSPVTYGVAPIMLVATGGASGNPVVFSILSGPGSVSGSTLTIAGAGTVAVAANQAGNSTYAPAPQVTQSVVVNQAAQTIAFSPLASPVTYPVGPITLSATGGASGNPVVFSVLSGPGSVTGSTLTITGTGTVAVAANQAGNANYGAAPQVTQSVVVNQVSLLPQTIALTAPPSPVTYGVAPIMLVATGGGSGNPVVFSVLSGPGSVSGGTLTITGAGTVSVAANQAGNSTYAPAPQVTQSVQVNQAAQTITFTPPASPVIFGVSSIALSATGGASGNPVIFSVISGPGSISGSTLTITGAGTVVAAANQAGNANYATAAQMTESVVVTQAPQAISFAPPASPVTFGSIAESAPVFTLVQKCHPASNTTNTCTFPNNVTPGDLVIGGAVIDNTIGSTGVNDGAGDAFTLSPNSPCTGGPVTSHGWVFYLLSSPGGANTNTVLFTDNDGSNPGDYVDEIWAYEFSVSGGTPSFDTDTNGCGATTSNADPSATLTLAGSNELAYFVSYLASEGLTGVGSPWTLGTLTQLRNVDGYDTNASSSITTAVTPAGQGWGIVMAMAITANSAGSIALSAAGGASGNPVAFTVVSGPGTITGNALFVTGAGTIVVAANQAGNANYAAAAQVTQSVQVNQASQTISFTAPTSPVTYGVAPITMVATGGASGNAVVYSVLSGPGSVSGNILTITGAGTVVVAVNQAGNTNYTAAPQVTQSITVNPAPQAIVFTPPTSPVSYPVAPITLSATGGASGNPVVFGVLSGPGTISGSTLTITDSGTVVVAANQAGNANYAAAAQVTQSVQAVQGSLTPQTITFTPPPSPVTYGVTPIPLSATGGASGNPVTFSVLSGPGNVSGSTLTITGAGTVVVATNQAGNSTYSAAPQVTQSVVVNQASQTINFTAPASPVIFGVAPISLSATGGASGNPVIFSIVSGPGTVSGGTLTITGAGTVVVGANQAGNTNYTAAPQVTQSVVVNQASQTIAFTAPASPVIFGVAPISLSATGGASGNPVVFSIVSGPGTVSGGTLTITGVGTVVVAANQAGNANYTAAAQVTQSVVVNQAPQTIVFTAPASPVTYGVAPITLTATGGASGNPVTFTIVSGPGSISGSTLTIIGVGTVVVAANQAGNANYIAAAQVTQSVVVNSSGGTETVSAGQIAFAGDASGCNSSGLSCTISTTKGVTKMSSAFTSGSIVTMVVDGEGTAVWPAVNAITCLGNSSCGTWVHISNGSVVQCGSGSSNCSSVTNGNYCQSNDLNSSGHRFFADCYYLLVTGSGVTGITVTFTDTSGGSDVTNMDLFIQEFKCSTAPCPTPTVTAQGTTVYPGNGSSNGCSSCNGPSMTVSGTNNIVIQNSVFEENCGHGTCSCTNYTLQSWDSSDQNATAYAVSESTAPVGIWPQSSKAGGIFTAFALNIGAQ
jgi:hypothetical protein